MALSERSKIMEIYEHEKGRYVLEQYLPRLVRSPSFQMTRCMSFRTVCRFHKWKLKRAVYAQAKAELENVNT